MRIPGVRTRRGPAGLLVALAGLGPATVWANGDPTPVLPTVFERFVLSACAPCVRESFPVATLPVAPLALPAFARMAASAAARPGEIAIDVIRARQSGRPDWQSLALRVTLSVTTGSGSDTYRLASGLLDGADVPALARAVADMVGMPAALGPDARSASADFDFHGGSLRIGVVRVGSEAVAYVQLGDLATLMQRPVWEVPTTLYLPVANLPALAAALARAATTIETVRGN
jgi:hypothetical protein